LTTTARSTGTRTVLIVLLVLWPLLPHVPYDFLNTAILACEYCVVTLSLVLLIGLVGQISLCQAALVGMGAFVSALATRKLGMQFPATLVVGTIAGAVTAAIIGTVALRVRGLYLAVATLIFGFLCDRYLFGQVWLVQSQSGTSIPFEIIGKQGTVPSFDLADARVFYFVALAVVILALYGVANLRDSRIGRAFAAVRGSEVAAASLGINVVRIKLLGFACAGALAGLGGALTLMGSRTVAPDQFNFVNSLYFLSIAVVGGLRSLGGAVASALLFAILVGEVFFRFPTMADYLDLVSALLLIGVLLFFRGGLGALPEKLPRVSARVRSAVAAVSAVLPKRSARSRGSNPAGARANRAIQRTAHQSMSWARRLRQRAALLVTPVAPLLPPVRQEDKTPAEKRAGSASGMVDVFDILDEADSSSRPSRHALHVDGSDHDEPNLNLRTESVTDRVAGSLGAGGRREPTLLLAEHITVRFGGLVAVNDASLRVGAGEIVGLIGPNGAGKTTLFNSVLGLNSPNSGKVSLFARDVTKWDVHRRAALGVGRTFQILQLFGELTVFDNLLVATHLQNRTGIWGGLAVSRRARYYEEIARERVQAVIRLMDLGAVADQKVAGLPFGVLRLVEVARTLVTGARLVCFDEPASGLDSAETERLLEWFRFLRRIGITLLVIEHDVSFVVRLCDYIYVLDQGHLIAEGTPTHIQRDPQVIASYLGTALEEAS
jgi:branched-chain amino acid transport system ATP-binding protein